MAGWRRRGGLIGGLALLCCVICFGPPWGAAVAAKDKTPAGPAAKAADVAHDATSSAVAPDRADQSRTSAAAQTGATRKAARAEAAKQKKKGIKKDSAKKGDARDKEDDEAPAAELVERAMAVQDRNTDQLMSRKGIVGTATGVDEDGNVVIRVYTSGADNPQIPATLEGIPVESVLSGPIHATAFPAKPLATQPPTAKFSRPVPIGISSMADTSLCAAATLGCRVKDSNHPANVYALSCNHVYALENQGQVAVTPASQPSPLDINCQVIPGNDFGTLTAFIPIDFSGQNNIVDGALVQTTTALVGNSTQSNGYGTPRSTAVSAALRQSVQKYGRTTGQTKGRVSAINVTVSVGYDSGTARFVKQIEVVGSGFSNFSRAGDSGSLVVDSQLSPVGILFAGGGRYTFCNPIGDVLQQLSAKLSTPQSQVSLAVDGN